ncbi:MAG: hypothetical protein ACK4ND_20205, partial [Cytophagaceae bacterium]
YALYATGVTGIYRRICFLDQMNIKEQLIKEHSKANTLRIACYIEENPLLFSQLMDYFFEDDYTVAQRAAWVLRTLGDKNPSLLNPYLERMVQQLTKDVHNGVKRNTLALLQNYNLPEHLLGITTNSCFDLLSNKKSPVAIKVFAITVLANICKKEPDLFNELKITVEDQLPYSSPAFRSRARKILK